MVVPQSWLRCLPWGSADVQGLCQFQSRFLHGSRHTHPCIPEDPVLALHRESYISIRSSARQLTTGSQDCEPAFESSDGRSVSQARQYHLEWG